MGLLSGAARPEAPPALGGVVAIVLVTLFVAGCIDPRAQFEDFAARPYAQPDAAAIEHPDTPCAQLLAQNLDGTYFTSCLVYDLMDNFGLAFEQRVTTRDDGSSELQLSFTPLLKTATDITQVSGDRVTLMPTTISRECTFDQPVGDITLPVAANSTGRDLAGLGLRLRGRLLSASRQCAILTGEVPLLRLELIGDRNVCQFYRANPGDALPMPLIPGDYGCDPTGLPPAP